MLAMSGPYRCIPIFFLIRLTSVDMRTASGHRKLVKHDDAPGEAHALTFSCVRRLQLLRLNSRCELLAESIDRAMHTQQYELLAYVFMPEYVRLFGAAATAGDGHRQAAVCDQAAVFVSREKAIGDSARPDAE